MKTAREGAYLDAVSQLYAGFETIDQRTRLLAYRDAMANVASANPDDTEAAIFYALALAVAASPTDKTYADQLKAGAILEKLVVNQPDHPGLAHYIIHAYDAPPLADRALQAARRYATIAPSAPHALHMPSHTFTRLGYWQESIDTNIASAEAAKRDGATGEELHTMDYRTYAYLQTGQDGAARGILDALPAVRSRFDPDAIGSAAPGSAGVFALAAIPARYALERGAWADAASARAPAESLSVCRCADLLREGTRRGAYRRRAGRALSYRGVGRDRGQADGSERSLLGRADANPAPVRVSVAGPRRRPPGGRAGSNARRGGDGRWHREIGGNAGAPGAGARARRRDVVADEPARRCARGVRSDAQQGTEQVSGAVGGHQVRGARRRSSESSRVRGDAVEDLRARGQARTPGAGRGPAMDVATAVTGSVAEQPRHRALAD